jgi:flagellar motor switch protein FliN/FliY
MCTDDEAFAATYHAASYTTIVDGTIAGHPFRFVQAVPHSLVVQLTAALAQLDVEHVDLTAQEIGERIGMAALSDVPLHCSIELGSTMLPVQRAGRLRAGEVVPLDQEDTAPLVLRLSGRPYALGYLRPTASGELDFEITEIIR